MRWLWTMLLVGCAAHAPTIPGPLHTLAWARRDGPPPSDTPDVHRPRPTGTQPSAQNGRIADAARWYLDHPTTGFRSDCSGFVEAVTARAKVPRKGSTRDLWSQMESLGATHRRSRPSPGDLVFFDNTYDRDGDGRTDDPLTHLGVVIAIAADGTVTFAQDGTSKGRSTMRLNMAHPHEARGPDGEVWNDALRARRDSDPPGTHYLTAELVRGFAAVPTP